MKKSLCLIAALFLSFTSVACTRIQARMSIKEGNEAYAQENWATAVKKYEEARKLDSGFAELDESAHPRGIRLLGRVGRLPEQVRDELLRHFRSLEGMLAASKSELEAVDGIGAARAAMLRRHFDRWRTTAATWEPDLSCRVHWHLSYASKETCRQENQ